MNKNEIKKALYKQKPLATFNSIKSGIAYYNCIITGEYNRPFVVNFVIPVDDMGEAEFLTNMEGHFLNRWIKE